LMRPINSPTYAVPRKNFKKLPEDIKKTLSSLSQYSLGNPFPSNRRHDEIARELMQSRFRPRSIIVFEELLDDAHWNDRRFVKITRDKIISEIDEAVFRNFGQELNERMAEYLKKHHDPDDEHLRTLLPLMPSTRPQTQIFRGENKKTVFLPLPIDNE